MIFMNSTQDVNASENAEASEENAPLTEAETTLASFWPTITDEIKRIKTVDARNQVLPLARIKKIMKLDEDVKMISAEAPLLFAKAAEIFIHELTLRAWIHTENNKRRTLQRNDIAMAITKYDQFDFLIDIVPREEIKPQRKDSVQKPTTNCDQVQYDFYLQLAQHHQKVLNNGDASAGTIQVGGATTSTVGNAFQSQAVSATAAPATTIQNTIPTTIQLPGQIGTPIAINANGTPQNILVTNTGQPIASVGGTAAMLNNLGGIHTTAQSTQPIQLLQQIVSPNGEIQHVPISIPQNQLNFLRIPSQNQNNAQPIIISAQPQTILQMAQPQSTTGVYLAPNTNDD